jgi:hypothetical protein
MIDDENFAYLSAHHQNIDHYRRLLRTSLTALERNFIERRIVEERKAPGRLASETLPIVMKEQASQASTQSKEGDVS